MQSAPGLQQALRNLAGALLELDPGRAATCLAQALAEHPDDATLHFLSGNLHRARGEDERAAAAYREAIRREDSAAPRINLAALHQDAGRFDEALRCYDDALRCEPRNVLARFNRSLLLLLTEKFKEGLADYELRWQLPELAGRIPEFGRPAWQGEALSGRTILLYAEQGFGDALQFARYIAPIARSAGRVLVHCPAKLREIGRASCRERV